MPQLILNTPFITDENYVSTINSITSDVQQISLQLSMMKTKQQNTLSVVSDISRKMETTFCAVNFFRTFRSTFNVLVTFVNEQSTDVLPTFHFVMK